MAKQDICVYDVTDVKKYHWENIILSIANFIEIIFPIFFWGLVFILFLFSPLGGIAIIMGPIIACFIFIPIFISKISIRSQVRISLFLLYNICVCFFAYYPSAFVKMCRFWACFLIIPTILYVILLIFGKRDCFDPLKQFTNDGSGMTSGVDYAASDKEEKTEKNR